MSIQNADSHRQVKAVLNFTDPSFGDQSVMDDVHRENIRMKLIPHEVVIDDMRVRAGELSLERNAVVLVKNPPRVKDFYSTQQNIERDYYPQVAELVKRLAHADLVECFGFAVRGRGEGSPAGARKPVMNVHIDYSPATAKSVADRIAPDGWKRRSDWRFKVINVWRPIAPVERNPLAVADGSTLTKDDLFVCRLNASRSEVADSCGWNVAYSPKQRWFYVSDMQPDEALVFTLIDSDPSGVQWAAHSSFDDPTSRPNARPRQSIEVRTIAYFAN